MADEIREEMMQVSAPAGMHLWVTAVMIGDRRIIVDPPEKIESLKLASIEWIEEPTAEIFEAQTVREG